MIAAAMYSAICAMVIGLACTTAFRGSRVAAIGSTFVRCWGRQDHRVDIVVGFLED
jgi:hypothetical protein